MPPITQAIGSVIQDSVCNNLKDAKDYTLQHLQTNIVMDLQAFYKDLGITNLEECKVKLDVIEETVHQCRVAIKNENSRRFLQDQGSHLAT